MPDILIVEDGLHERERLSKLFTSAMYSVSCAESVQEAERLLEFEQFRLAVVDIGLGDKSGSFLFEQLKRSAKVPFVVILTGNPSTHLKQRFLDEGAATYIVKASPSASNEALLEVIQGLLGAAAAENTLGIPLGEFLRQYVTESSRQLFLDEGNELPACRNCGANSYVVSFSHKTQLPPLLEGKVICSSCFQEMDPEVK